MVGLLDRLADVEWGLDGASPGRDGPSAEAYGGLGALLMGQLSAIIYFNWSIPC